MFIPNTKKIILLVISFVLIFIFFKNQPINDKNINYIPFDTFILASFNLSKLTSEQKYLNFINSENGEIIINLLKEYNIPKKIRDFIKYPSSIGIDNKKNIYISSSVKTNEMEDFESFLSLNFIFPIKDFKSVSKNINQHIDFIPDKKIDILDGELKDFKYYLFKNRFNEKRDLAMLSYNQDVILLSISPLNSSVSIDLKKQLNDILDGFNLKDEKKLTYLDNNQISIWCDLTKVSKYQSDSILPYNSYINDYFSNFLLFFNYIGDEIQLNLFSFFNFNSIVKEFYYPFNFINKKTVHFFKNTINLEELVSIKKLDLGTQNITFNHGLDLNSYKLSIKEKVYIDKQDLKTYIYNKFIELIALF